MTKKIAIAIALLCCQISVAKSPENSELLPDPTVANTAKLRASPSAPTEKTAETPNKDGIEDPTKLNRNFRAALNLKGDKAPAGVVANIPTAPTMPVIKLLALACEHHKEKNHAMISIDGKSQMLAVGEKTTTLTNNRIVEIDVLDIQKTHVRLRLQPNNDILILR